MLPWLWCRPEATAPIRPLAWEPPYVVGVLLAKKERKKKKDLDTLKFIFTIKIKKQQ